MKKHSFLAILAAVLFFTLITQASGQARTWELDKAHSNIYFSVDHIFSKVHGHFNDYTAEINFDPTNLADSSFVFEIETKSIDTNIAKRDKHLQSDDFFGAGKFPMIKFSSEQVTDVGNNVYEVKGKLVLKGKTYDLTLPLTLAGIKAHPAVKGKDVIGFNGTMTIDRLEYGVGNGKFYQMGVVGKEVDILVSMELLGEK